MKSEIKLLEWLQRQPASKRVRLGIGHDAAVVVAPSGQIVLKVDQVVEGIHFPFGTDPALIGHKALARPLSDLAAMGALPDYFLCSMAIPAYWNNTMLQKLIRAARALGKRFHCELVGGDLSSTKSALVVSMSVMGHCGPGNAVSRTGARPGDRILVSGSLGGSILGKHLRFLPRLHFGRLLRQHRLVSSMMDISDGLSLDLWRLCRMSAVGAFVFETQVPISTDAKRLAKKTRKQPLFHALHDGEDYELLFTMSEEQLQKAKRIPGFRNMGCQEIGRIVSGQGLFLKNNRAKLERLQPQGYAHRWQ